MHLDISQNNLVGLTGVTPVQDMLQQEDNQVRILQIGKNPLGNAGIEKLASALKHQHCKLK